jgi:ferrochelatase
MVAELVAEHLHAAAPRSLGDVAADGSTVNGVPCAVDCCQPVRLPR